MMIRTARSPACCAESQIFCACSPRIVQQIGQWRGASPPAAGSPTRLSGRLALNLAPARLAATRRLFQQTPDIGRRAPAHCPRRARRPDRCRSAFPSPRYRRSCPPDPPDGVSGSMASARRSRVSGVRKSCDTPASMVVRCARKRRSRSCMRLNAVAARRTSIAPSGRIGPGSRPMPNASAATARRLMPRTWLRRNKRRDAEQQAGGADQPDQESIKRADIQPLARHIDAQHPIDHLHIDADKGRRGIPGHVERPVQMAASGWPPDPGPPARAHPAAAGAAASGRAKTPSGSQNACRSPGSPVRASSGSRSISSIMNATSPATASASRRESSCRWLP